MLNDEDEGERRRAAPRAWVVATLVTLCAFLRAASALAEVRGVVADPVRNVFHVSFDFGVLAAIDAATNLSVASVGFGEETGSIAIEPDGSRIYVALLESHDVAVVDATAYAVTGIIDLSAMTTGPMVLTMGRPGRLHAICDYDLATVDLASRTEIDRRNPVGGSDLRSVFDIVRSPDGSRLYTLNTSSPVSILVLDVATDSPTLRSEECTHVCFESWGGQLALSRDGTRLYAAVQSDTELRIAPTTLLPLAPTHGVPLPSRATAVAVSPDGELLLAGTDDGHLVSIDSHTLLPYRVTFAVSDIARRGLVMSSDGRSVGIVSGAVRQNPSGAGASFTVRSLEDQAPTHGGVVFGPVDAETGVALTAVGARGCQRWDESGSGMLDAQAGRFAYAGAQPGPCTLTIENSNYETVTREVVVEAGRWADLGTVPLVRRGSPSSVRYPCVVPEACVGTTFYGQLVGRGYSPNVLVTGRPGITVDGYAWVNFGRVDVTLTIDPGVSPGRYTLAVENPGAFAGVADLIVRSAADPAALPREVEGLRVRKVGTDLHLSWSQAVIGSDECSTQVGSFEVSSATAADQAGTPWLTTSSTPLYVVGEALPSGANRYLVVRARDVLGNLGP